MVNSDQAFWTQPPDREEVGSPNVMGGCTLYY